MKKGIFIEGITVEMLKSASLETVEELICCGDIIDVELPLKKWIPVSKKLPEKEGRYWVWAEKSFVPDHVDEPNRYQGSTEAAFMGGRWYGRDVEEVIAWMPLPEPYSGGI